MIKTHSTALFTSLAAVLTFAAAHPGHPLAAATMAPVLAEGRDSLVTLTLAVEGASTDEGQVLVALFDTEEGFTDDPVLAAILKAGIDEVLWTVEVAPGTYAAAAVHDKDANGELNKNFLGMPREPYGFSNDARGRTGPPSFRDASFEVRDGPGRRWRSRKVPSACPDSSC